jgi:cellulose synthase/poly-beta-1,6-N-acetylglucosamine synthase-like glycosyltransferase
MTTTTLLLLAVGLLLLLAAVYPFGPYQLSLLLAKRLGRFKAPGGDPETAPPLRFAICLCAYNEAGVIRDKVENMLAMRRAAGELDILVYVDAATDRTAEILRGYGDRITLYDSKERHGKPWGMNRLVTMTEADILLFTDANVMVDEQAVQHLRRYFADPEVGCVCSHLVYVNPSESATAEVGSAYWKLDEWTKGLDTDTGSAMGADGSLFAIRRKLHRPTPDHLLDDLFVSLSILCQGYRLVRAPEMCAFESHTTIAEDEFQRKIRIACQCIGVHRTLWSELRRLSAWNLYKYFSHRYLRWIGGYLLLGAGLCFAGALGSAFGALAMLATVIVGGLAFALGLAMKFGPALQIWNVLLAFAGNALGVWRAYWGEPVVTWDLAGSARKNAAGNQSSG